MRVLLPIAGGLVLLLGALVVTGLVLRRRANRPPPPGHVPSLLELHSMLSAGRITAEEFERLKPIAAAQERQKRRATGQTPQEGFPEARS